ncbi:hypothetical protein [Bradyrhizobium prioriisuperbiae]|uniref:hypothetical protein n=1 Tax=Bradyrhizobium prioriisuperbiae TaxID=2854389 RepID=UPI0028F031B3|nr:hypothetical protein [Bradyrhizobium prioritasuperba]
MRRQTYATAALLILVSTTMAFARPPTTTTSPGYDRRLQESRRPAQEATQPYLQPPSPYPGDRRHHRKRKARR